MRPLATISRHTVGAMQAAVAFQLAHWTAPGAEGLSDGDGARADAEGGCARSVLAHTLRPVLMSNHPQLAGGSHLPDITVITPVFVGAELVFFVASRGHHADGALLHQPLFTHSDTRYYPFSHAASGRCHPRLHAAQLDPAGPGRRRCGRVQARAAGRF